MFKIKNKKAFFNYEIISTMVAGIVLKGLEIKGIRAGRASLQGAYVSIRHGEVYLKNMHIETEEPLRDRKLLLNKREIIRFEKKLNETGMSIIPLKVFHKKGLAKVEIALCKGKKQFDKRATLKKRDEKRNIQMKLKQFSRK